MKAAFIRSIIAFALLLSASPSSTAFSQDSPVYVVQDIAGNTVDASLGVRGNGLTEFKVYPGAGYKITAMEVSLVRGTLRVKSLSFSSGNVDIHSWGPYMSAGDKIIISIQSVVKVDPSGKEKAVAIKDGVIRIPIS